MGAAGSVVNRRAADAPPGVEEGPIGVKRDAIRAGAPRWRG